MALPSNGNTVPYEEVGLAPGTWDFTGVLFSMSGFILAGSGYLLYRMADLCRSFGLEPVILESSDVSDVLTAFLSWADQRLWERRGTL